MKSTKFIDDLSKMTGMTDTELAKSIGISQPAMSNLKAGRRIMENETCIAVALQLGIDPMQIIMAADIDRAERAGQHSLWEVFMQRTAQATSSALLKGIFAVAFVTNFLTPHHAEAATTRVADGQIVNSVNYAKFICKDYIVMPVSC